MALVLLQVNAKGVFRYAATQWFTKGLQFLSQSGVRGVAVDCWVRCLLHTLHVTCLPDCALRRRAQGPLWCRTTWMQPLRRGAGSFFLLRMAL
jgi:hypothetical protein